MSFQDMYTYSRCIHRLFWVQLSFVIIERIIFYTITQINFCREKYSECEQLCHLHHVIQLEATLTQEIRLFLILFLLETARAGEAVELLSPFDSCGFRTNQTLSAYLPEKEHIKLASKVLHTHGHLTLINTKCAIYG